MRIYQTIKNLTYLSKPQTGEIELGGDSPSKAQRLAEPPRPRNEEKPLRAGSHEPVEIVSLVDVNAVPSVRRAEIHEVIGVLGNRPHAAIIPHFRAVAPRGELL